MELGPGTVLRRGGGGGSATTQRPLVVTVELLARVHRAGRPPGIRLLHLQTREPAVPRHRIFATPVASVHPHYVAKVERKGRTRDEVDEAICWLTGYDAAGLAAALDDQVDFEAFFHRAPAMTPHAELITGSICGVRVEDVEDPLMRKIRMLDELVDEIAEGRPMSRVLRGGDVSRSVGWLRDAGTALAACELSASSAGQHRRAEAPRARPPAGGRPFSIAPYRRAF